MRREKQSICSIYEESAHYDGKRWVTKQDEIQRINKSLIFYSAAIWTILALQPILFFVLFKDLRIALNISVNVFVGLIFQNLLLIIHIRKLNKLSK